ncbi:putative HTLV-1-related endogenous sequence [Melanotaenia boesemani]|uniref:putative HTLV-1-related endogenous sequence n=1 Tax=Melanotaenia boesemani TaxID=1250792 RepID=UPI001C0556F8|nr:putative HTLV-1-related endogenous sequence [Melanotaenia boesemani]
MVSRPSGPRATHSPIRAPPRNPMELNHPRQNHRGLRQPNIKARHPRDKNMSAGRGRPLAQTMRSSTPHRTPGRYRTPAWSPLHSALYVVCMKWGGGRGEGLGEGQNRERDLSPRQPTPQLPAVDAPASPRPPVDCRAKAMAQGTVPPSTPKEPPAGGERTHRNPKGTCLASGQPDPNGMPRATKTPFSEAQTGLPSWREAAPRLIN